MSSRPTKESFSLKCVLTEDEKLKYGSEMSEAISSKSRKEDDLKSVSTQFKAEIAALDARVGAIAEKIRSGSEYRDVECLISYDWDRKVRSWSRRDTGEIYKEDIIPEYMLQEEMKLNHADDERLAEESKQKKQAKLLLAPDERADVEGATEADFEVVEESDGEQGTETEAAE